MRVSKERFCAGVWSVCLAVSGLFWLCLVGENSNWYNSFSKGAVLTLPANMILFGVVLFYSCIFKKRFISLETGRIGQITPDIISGFLMGTGYFLVLLFFSPPLPFGGGTTCATGDNDISYLVLAALLLALRYYWGRLVNSKGGKNEIDSGGKDCRREAT